MLIRLMPGPWVAAWGTSVARMLPVGTKGRLTDSPFRGCMLGWVSLLVPHGLPLIKLMEQSGIILAHRLRCHRPWRLRFL